MLFFAKLKFSQCLKLKLNVPTLKTEPLSIKIRKVQKLKSDAGMDIGMLQREINQNSKDRRGLESNISPRSKYENKKIKYHITKSVTSAHETFI